MLIKLNINGISKNFDVKPDDYLVDTLRDNNYLSVKRGCDTSSCGVCTVLIDNKPIASCSYLTVKAEGHEITTAEGISEEIDKMADYFGKEGADQCGFCNPSLAITLYSLKNEIKNPTDDDIKMYLAGNLCRCTGYVAQHNAIKSYLEDEL